MADENLKQVQEIANPELIKAMLDMKSENSNQNQQKFIMSLLTAKLIVPVKMTKKADDPTKLQVTFAKLTTNDGTPFFPCFTDIKTLVDSKRYGDEGQVLGVTYNDFEKMLSDPTCPFEGFAINPFTENVIVTKAQIEVIKKLKNSSVPQNGEQVMIADLKEEPEELTKALCAFFKQHKEVEKAYLLALKHTVKENMLVLVDFDGDKKALFEGLVELLKPFENPEKPFLIMEYNTDFGKQAAVEKVPFYVNV